jgi:hypothetical protein
MTEQNKTRVAQYWIEKTNPSHWRKWLPPHLWSRALDNNTLEGFLEDLGKRRIQCSKQQDLLRWGTSTSRNFSTKEAYEIATKHNKLPQAQIWNKLWNQNLWPKLSTFLWLLSLNKALT